MAYYDPRKEEEILSERAAAAGAGDPSAAAGGPGSGGVVPAEGGGADDFAADGYALGPDESLTAGGAVVSQSAGTTRGSGSGDAAAGRSAAGRVEAKRAAERAATEADLEDWYRYVPKPDYETLERRARRQEQAALLGDIAQIAGQFYGTAGKNGGWIVQPLGNRYAKAQEKRDAVEARKRAAWQDYGGRQLSYLMSRRKERAAQDAAERKALLDYNYKIADLDSRNKYRERNAKLSRESLEQRKTEHEFNKKKHEDDLGLGQAKLGESRRQFDAKQKNGGGKNSSLKRIYAGRNRDGSRRFVEIPENSYDSAAGNVWNIMQGKYPDLEKRFKDWVVGEAEDNPDQFSGDELNQIRAILGGGGSVRQLKTSKNILNFAQAIDDQDVYDFFMDMAGQGNASGGGAVSGGAGAPASGSARAGTAGTHYYDAYLAGNNQSGNNPLQSIKKGNPLLKR